MEVYRKQRISVKKKKKSARRQISTTIVHSSDEYTKCMKWNRKLWVSISENRRKQKWSKKIRRKRNEQLKQNEFQKKKPKEVYEFGSEVKCIHDNITNATHEDDTGKIDEDNIPMTGKLQHIERRQYLQWIAVYYMKRSMWVNKMFFFFDYELFWHLEITNEIWILKLKLIKNIKAISTNFNLKTMKIWFELQKR